MSQKQEGKSVLVAGATGLVGRECVDLLLASPAFTRIVALVRHPLAKEIESERLKVEQVDFGRLDERPEIFSVNAIICALGTTMQAAGSEGAFRVVDYDYPLAIARMAFVRGARHFLLVSSMGADAASTVFYSRVKGELEDAVAGLGYASVTIVRPSLLVGDRPERRMGEEIAGRFAFLTPRRFRPVSAALVAATLVRAAQEEAPGRHVIENSDIR